MFHNAELQKADSMLSEEESQKVQIYFSARNLADLDLVSVTDSFIKVYIQETKKPRKQVLKTKIYWNDLNPDYAETVVTQFFFQVRQKVIVEVYHEDSPPKLIGTVQSTVGEIFGSKDKGAHKKILDGKNNERGQLILKCQKIQKSNNKIVQFQVKCVDLHCGSTFLCLGYNNAFFRLYKLKGKQEFLIYQSEMKAGSDSRYDITRVSEKKFCNNNSELPIIIRFYKQSQIAAPGLIGEAKFTQIQLQKKDYYCDLVRGGKNKGRIIFQSYRITKKDQFPDYLLAGMQMALEISIDFTGSNVQYKSPQSLHHTTSQKKSQYQQALEEVCNIVMDYDTDKLVPTYGFGAEVNMPNYTQSSVCHYFPLNGNQDDPNFYKVEGIMEGYRKCMQYLTFSGPTNFAPLLRESMKKCRQMKKQQKQYMILLILTDGAIHDKEQVKDLLVHCGRLPLSVIIIGIGNGPWGIMHQLDDDDCQMVDKKGNPTERDLVQFVEFKKFKGDGVLLAREVLQELPRQVQEYHQLCKLKADIYRKQ